MASRIHLSLSLVLVSLCALTGYAQQDEMTVSQLNLHAGHGQAAFVRFGMDKKQVYSVGAKSTGFYIEHNDKDVMSIDLDGKVTVRTELFTAENLSADRFTLNGVPQFQIAAMEMFDHIDPAKAGWFAGDSSSPTMACAGLVILTGPRGDLKVPNLDSFSKQYVKFPRHTQARIQATVHFIDDWQGETAYMKIDDQVVWTDSHDQRASRGQFHVCGSPSYPESKFSVPIDVTFPHIGDKLKISFGSTLGKEAMASFGVSSLTVSIRDKRHHHKKAPQPPKKK